MQIYANLCKFMQMSHVTYFKKMASAEPKYVHKFRKTMLEQIQTNYAAYAN